MKFITDYTIEKFIIKTTWNDLPNDVMHEKNYFEDTKYDLYYLGIGYMSKDQLLKYLYTGELE